MPVTISTNMLLPVPVVGSDPGPAYATNVNTCLNTIDVHDHSAGKGTPVTPSGINITSDLPFSGNNAIQLRTVRFQAQGNPITGSSTSDVGCVYVAGVDMYFNDANGVAIRITSGGGVAGSLGSITGLAAPATATYVSAQTAFVWQSNANIAANLDMRSAILRNSGASSFGLTLSAPTLGGNLAQVLPATPGSTGFMTMDSSGNMSAATPLALGITRPMQAAVGQQVSASCGTFNTSSSSYGTIGSLSVTLTTTGRPVMVMAVSAADGAFIGMSGTGVNNILGASFGFHRDGVLISGNAFQAYSSSSGTIAQYAPGSLNFLDVVASGTYVYSLRALSTGAGLARITNVKIQVYEL